MKEATGELSTTVIAIVAIAAILAVFTVFLLPTLKVQIALTQACSQGANSMTNGEGYGISCGAAATNPTEKADATLGTKKGSKTCGEGSQKFVCTYYEKKTK